MITLVVAVVVWIPGITGDSGLLAAGCPWTSRGQFVHRIYSMWTTDPGCKLLSTPRPQSRFCRPLPGVRFTAVRTLGCPHNRRLIHEIWEVIHNFGGKSPRRGRVCKCPLHAYVHPCYEISVTCLERVLWKTSPALSVPVMSLSSPSFPIYPSGASYLALVSMESIRSSMARNSCTGTAAR